VVSYVCFMFPVQQSHHAQFLWQPSFSQFFTMLYNSSSIFFIAILVVFNSASYNHLSYNFCMNTRADKKRCQWNPTCHVHFSYKPCPPQILSMCSNFYWQ
jgi:homospermidine synthase